MKKLMLLVLLGLVLCTIWLPGCTDPTEDIPVDSTAYLKVADALRRLDGDSTADEFLATADPRLVFLIEDTIRIKGETIISINGEPIFKGPMSNEMLAGMGLNFAYALAPGHGECGQISAMTADLGGDPENPITVTMSSPARTAGGRGANDYVTVQSTWTNTGSLKWLDAADLFMDVLNVNTPCAHQNGDGTNIPNGDTLQITWTVWMAAVSTHYQTAIRNDMAQGINPEAAWGGSVYTLNQGQWVFDVGNTGLLPNHSYTGGDGSTQELLIEWRYTHSGANRTVNEWEVYNSNSSLADENTSYGLDIVAGDQLRGFHRVEFLGL